MENIALEWVNDAPSLFVLLYTIWRLFNLADKSIERQAGLLEEIHDDIGAIKDNVIAKSSSKLR